MISKRHIFIIFSILCLFNIVIGQENTWTTNGPYEAKIAAISISPFDNRKIFLGTGEYGIYQSDDAGENWSHLDNETIPNTVLRIKFHPTNQDSIYIATDKGLLRTIDGGQNWNYVILPDHYVGDLFGFEIHPQYPNILYCCGLFYNFRSLDGGATWETMNLERLYVQKYCVDPINTNRVYLITHSGLYHKAIYKSENLGNSWECIHNNLDTTYTAHDMAIDPIDNNILYICGETLYGEECQCLAKSYNAGESWVDITPDSLKYSSVRGVFVSPLDHNTVVICTSDNGLLKSIDGGQTWEDSNGGLDSYFTDNIVYDSLSGTWYLSVLYNGLYKSTDDCASWEKISQNISHANCWGLTINHFNSNKLYLNSASHLYKTDNCGEQWDLIHDSIWCSQATYFTTNVLTDPVDSNCIYGGLVHWDRANYCGIYKSTDGGNTWGLFTDGLPDTSVFYKVAILNDNGNRRLFVCGSSGIYCSDNLGVSWNKCIFSPFDYVTIRCINASSSEPFIIVVSDNQGRFFKSEDKGDSWEEFNLPEDPYGGTDIEFDPNNSDIIYIATYGKGIFKSSDGGDSWDNITNNITYESGYFWLSGIAVNPFNPDNIYVNSHHHGLFQSHDGGQSWEPFNNDLNTLYSNAITVIDPSDTNRIYLATDQQSVWSITRTGTAVESSPSILSSTIDIAAYPNPFNAATRIEFTLPEAGEITADIYDILGRHVATVIDDYLFPGHHSVVWSPEGIATGQYYLRLSNQEITSHRKLLYLK